MSAYAPTQKPAMDSGSLRIPAMQQQQQQRHRKAVSTGGGRAWSEAEEAYLIETREHKMPYKHIAAQLKKTELACRLHYHQLSFGSKSRRNPSVSSSLHSYDRSSMTPPTRMRQSTPQLPLPSFSPPASPEDEYRTSSSKSNNTAEGQSHKPILPKPVVSPQRVAQDSRQLRLVTDDVDSYNGRQYVDIERLDRIYDAHRLHFWSTIARNYGCNLSPSTLEDAWRRAHGVSSTSNFPPTPRGSPQSAQPAPSILNTPYSAVAESSSIRGFTPVNNIINNSTESRAGSMPPRSRDSSVAPSKTTSSSSASKSNFAISSLLTENKEIRRSPTVERKLPEIEMAYSQ